MIQLVAEWWKLSQIQARFAFWFATINYVCVKWELLRMNRVKIDICRFTNAPIFNTKKKPIVHGSIQYVVEYTAARQVLPETNHLSWRLFDLIWTLRLLAHYVEYPQEVGLCLSAIREDCRDEIALFVGMLPWDILRFLLVRTFKWKYQMEMTNNYRCDWWSVMLCRRCYWVFYRLSCSLCCSIPLMAFNSTSTQ